MLFSISFQITYQKRHSLFPFRWDFFRSFFVGMTLFSFPLMYQRSCDSFTIFTVYLQFWLFDNVQISNFIFDLNFILYFGIRILKVIRLLFHFVLSSFYIANMESMYENYLNGIDTKIPINSIHNNFSLFGSKI